MRKFFKKHSLTVQLSTIFLVVVIVSVALIMEAIELSTAISIYAVLIAVAILFISVNEIRNRLRPWVAVASIDQEYTKHPNTLNNYFNIANTGPVPAIKVLYTVHKYIRTNSIWKEEVNITIKAQNLFPNQRVRYPVEIETGTYDTKVTFEIEYRGLWSKHTTTNTHRFDHIHKVWTPDEPQDYT
jgi:hypothetical protein